MNLKTKPLPNLRGGYDKPICYEMFTGRMPYSPTESIYIVGVQGLNPEFS